MSLFATTPRKRVEHMREMLDRGKRREQTARFLLAGVVASLDGESVTELAEVVSAFLRERARRLPDE